MIGCGVSLSNKQALDDLYASCNRRTLIHPDPLEFLYKYEDDRDREIVALIASSLAYGRVRQILKSISSVLEPMGPSPHAFLLDSSLHQILSIFQGFKHRFTTDRELSLLMWGIRQVCREYGSLHRCFVAGLQEGDDNVLPALSFFVEALSSRAIVRRSSLLPKPEKGSACKRLNLFLRWMVREDEVDPGGWNLVPESKLIVPLDTHMHRIGLLLNLTRRKQANMRTAIEITHAFREIAPQDPVRYDFSLTRLGIRDDMSLACFFEGQLP